MILIQIMYSRVLLNHVHWRLLEVDRFFSMDDGVCGGDFWQRTNGSDFFMFISRWQAKVIRVTLDTVSSTYSFQWMYWKAKTKPMPIKETKGIHARSTERVDVEFSCQINYRKQR